MLQTNIYSATKFPVGHQQVFFSVYLLLKIICQLCRCIVSVMRLVLEFFSLVFLLFIILLSSFFMGHSIICFLYLLGLELYSKLLVYLPIRCHKLAG